MRISFGNRISVRSWAQIEMDLATQSFASRYKESGEELEIDLSAVGFADFIILGRLLVLISAFASAGSVVSIRMPSTFPLEREIPYLRPEQHEADHSQLLRASRLALRRRQRINCRLFMQQAGFESALKVGNWAAHCVKVTESETDVARQATFDEIDADLFETIKVPQRHRRFLPYKWLRPDATSLEARAETAEIDRALHAIGFAREDSASIAHGIIRELIENVRRHASGIGHPSTPLLGLTVIEPPGYAHRFTDFEPYLGEYVGWASQLSTPIVRLLVGDSGRGIGGTSKDERDAPSQSGLGQAAIFDALSRRQHTPIDRTGLQGLWKVQQIVKTYTGSLAIRSGKAQAGYIFTPTEDPKVIRASSDVWLPGTIAECNILADRQPHMPQRDAELPSPVPIASGAYPKILKCISASLKPLDGLDQEDLTKIRDGLHSAYVSNEGLVIAIEILAETKTLADDEFVASIGSLLHAATEFDEHPALAIAFAGANRNLLALTIQDLNLRHDLTSSSGAGGTQVPILVLAERVHYWAGGSGPLRNLHGRLSQSRSPLSIGDLSKIEGSEQISQLANEDALGPFIKAEGSGIALTFRPQDALAAMARLFGGKMAEAIYSDSAVGVECGMFLAPSTRYISRWINVAELLQGLGCLNSSSLALAFLVEQKIGYLLASAYPLAVHPCGSITDDMVESFSSSLRGSASSRVMAPADAVSRTATRRPISDGSAIICTDLISSEHSVRAALADVIRSGAAPVAVATFVDARDTASTDDEDHIRLGELAVPLIRLSRVSIVIDESSAKSRRVTIIDPTLGQPLARRPVYARTMALQDKYVEAVVRTSGARLGHIVSSANRHYSAYVDPSLVYRDKLFVGTAVSAIVSRLRAAHHDAGLREDDGICVVYPSPVGDSLSEFIDVLADALRGAGLSAVGQVQVARTFAARSWRYPASIRLPESAAHILVVDAGSRSGGTARQLIRLCSEPTVQAITAVILANGMEESEAIALQQLRVLEKPTNPRRASKQLVSVEVSYLTRTAVIATSPAQCSLCELRNSYSLASHHLPPLLAEQQGFLLEALHVRSKADIFAHQVFDLFGVPIEQEDCIAYLRLCAHLRDARFSTTERAALVQHIRQIVAELPKEAHRAKAGSIRDALIRVLAADRAWIERDPLAFDSVRPLVADIAESLLLGRPPSVVDPMLRIQAAIVLVSADCYRFAARIASILEACADHHLVSAHVLLEAMKLVDLPQQDIRLLQILANSLTRMEHNSDPAPRGDLAPTGLDATAEIKHVAAVARMQLPISTGTRQAAWNALLNYAASVRDHSYDQAMWRLLVTADNLRDGISIDDPDEALDDWLTCSDGLLSNVFPNLKVLSRYFTRPRVTQHFSYWHRSRWEGVVNGSGPRLTGDMTARLITIFRRPATTIADDDQLLDITADLEWWSRFFFSAQRTAEGVRRYPILADVVTRCPADAYSAIREVFKQTTCRVAPPPNQGMDLRVFCTRGLLSDVFTHIRINAAEDHRDINKDSQEFAVDIASVDEDVIRVTVLNSSSRPRRTEGGRGLAALNDDLSAFDAKLETVKVSAPWTYGIALTAQLWKGM